MVIELSDNSFKAGVGNPANQHSERLFWLSLLHFDAPAEKIFQKIPHISLWNRMRLRAFFVGLPSVLFPPLV